MAAGLQYDVVLLIVGCFGNCDRDASPFVPYVGRLLRSTKIVMILSADDIGRPVHGRKPTRLLADLSFVQQGTREDVVQSMLTKNELIRGLGLMESHKRSMTALRFLQLQPTRRARWSSIPPAESEPDGTEECDIIYLYQSDSARGATITSC